MASRFTAEAAEAINTAFSEAARLGHSYVGSEHLLIALTLSNTGAAMLLREAGLDAQTLRRRMKASAVPDGECADITPKLRRLLHISLEGAVGQVDPYRLLWVMMNESCAARRLAGDAAAYIIKEISMAKNIKAERTPTPLLDKCGFDLTEQARLGKLDPVIGREKEEEQILRILLRRSKNNPCLIGEPGVGKTAVAESIALRIARGDVPEPLAAMRLVSIDIPSLVAGTKYRGEFEDKLRGIIEELRRAGDIILFADEIHTVVGAGAAEGAIDASNILKPYLARGEIRLMGATTEKEYRKYIEKDGALDRRFQTVSLSEPTEEECLYILQGIRRCYERFHGIEIKADALKSAVELSVKYISGRCLPDKAIDLLDEAAAAKRMEGGKKKVLTPDDIATAAERFAGAPLRKRASAKALAAEVKTRVFGQDKAVEAAAEALLSFKENGGTLLLCGAACCGKTTLAKSLAEALYGKANIRRFDLSLCGFDFPAKIGKKPCAALLLENAHKASPDALRTLYALLDNGVYTDTEGVETRLPCRTLIITATENTSPLGFLKQSVRAGGELACRADATVLLSAPDGDTFACIVEHRLADTLARLKGKGVRVDADKGFAAAFAEDCAEKGENARRLQKRLSSLLSPLFADDAPPTAHLSFENGAEKLKIPAKNY